MKNTMPVLADVSDQIETVTRSDFDAVVLKGEGPIAVEFTGICDSIGHSAAPRLRELRPAKRLGATDC